MSGGKAWAPTDRVVTTISTPPAARSACIRVVGRYPLGKAAEATRRVNARVLGWARRGLTFRMISLSRIGAGNDSAARRFVLAIVSPLHELIAILQNAAPQRNYPERGI